MILRILIDKWLVRTSLGRSNIAPESIPWDALRSLLTETVYGGKIDVQADYLVLEDLVQGLFTPSAYDLDFLLVGDPDQQVKIPDGSKAEQFITWTENLPDREPPVWLGLREDAQELMLAEQGTQMLNDVKTILIKLDEAEF